MHSLCKSRFLDTVSIFPSSFFEFISFHLQQIPLHDFCSFPVDTSSRCGVNLAFRLFYLHRLFVRQNFPFLSPLFLRHNSLFFPLAFSGYNNYSIQSRFIGSQSFSWWLWQPAPFLMDFRSVFPAVRISPLLSPPLRQSLEFQSSPEGLGQFRCAMHFIIVLRS